jgi:hypothetical protein
LPHGNTWYRMVSHRQHHDRTFRRRRSRPGPADAQQPPNDSCHLLTAPSPTNFTNLVLSKARDGTIVLAPHAVGLCTIILDEDGATAVRDVLTEWLGG